MSTQRFLYNTINPGCAGTPQAFRVALGNPAVLTAMGLLPGQLVPVEVEVRGVCNPQDPCPTIHTHWAPLARGGCVTALSSTHTQHIELVPGTYRLNTSSLPPAQPVAIGLEIDENKFGIPLAACVPTSPCGPDVCAPAAPLGALGTWG